MIRCDAHWLWHERELQSDSGWHGEVQDGPTNQSKNQRLAVHLLEANPHALTYADGNVSGKGSPDRSPSFGDIAAYAGSSANMPVGDEPVLDEGGCDKTPK